MQQFRYALVACYASNKYKHTGVWPNAKLSTYRLLFLWRPSISIEPLKINTGKRTGADDANFQWRYQTFAYQEIALAMAIGITTRAQKRYDPV